MAILIDEDTKVVIQGMTGKAGTYYANQCMKYGTKIVGGVTPGKGGIKVLGKPIFDTVYEAKKKTDCNTSLIFVPASVASHAIIEAIDAGIDLIICITEGIPALDMCEVKKRLINSKSVLIGPNSPGIISSGLSQVGIIPNHISKRGKIAILSRSGTLLYESILQTSSSGLGQSTAIGIGGDSIRGLDFIDYMPLLEEDPQTKAILLIGEIGGNSEEEVAKCIRYECGKPVAAFIAGISAPPNKRMGHAGAIVSNGKGVAQEKISALKDAGVEIVPSVDKFSNTLKTILG